MTFLFCLKVNRISHKCPKMMNFKSLESWDITRITSQPLILIVITSCLRAVSLCYLTYTDFKFISVSLISSKIYLPTGLHKPSIAYLKKRSFTLRTVVPSDSMARRVQTLLIKSSTTWFTSSEKRATSRGRMMSCRRTLRIFSHSSPSL